jgi:hypothetical protein
MRAGHDLTNHSLTGTLCLLLSISQAVPNMSSRYWDRGNPFTLGSKKRKAFLQFGTVPSKRKTLKASQTTPASSNTHQHSSPETSRGSPGPHSRMISCILSVVCFSSAPTVVLSLSA